MVGGRAPSPPLSSTLDFFTPSLLCLFQLAGDKKRAKDPTHPNLQGLALLFLSPLFLPCHLPFFIPSSDSSGGCSASSSSSMALTADAQFHVLAVDDSLLDRKLIERLLRTSSYQVTTVDSGSKALEFLGLQDDQYNSPSVSPYHQEIEVNLVITDYCMPGMTGYDLLKKIKETSSLKDIPVVIMSSENVPSRINRCLEEGAEEFFLKPVQKSDMERLIPHIMKRKSTEQGQLEEQQPLELPQNNYNNLCTAITTDTSSSSNSNKRKAMDEALSPERTRPRCTVTA